MFCLEKKKFFLTVRETKTGKIISVCDKNIVGKVFEENETVMDLRTSFYYEEGLTIEADIEKIIEEITDAFTSSIVGNEIVEILLKQGIIRNFREICGIKYAMTVRI